MKTIREVCNQIRWDPAFDEKSFRIGYREHSGTCESSLAGFDPETIPWNRVQYLKLGEAVVWDRERRIDMFADGTVRQLLGKTLPDEGPFWADLPTYRCDLTTGNWAQAHSGAGDPWPRPLRLVTFNVLFDLHHRERIYTEERIPLIFELLRECRADIIGLQEVTPHFLGELLRQPWVREGFYVSDSPAGGTVSPYGQVLLSRLPVRRLCRHSYSQEKKVLAAELAVGDKTVVACVVHLSSHLTQNPEEKRCRQLESLLPNLGGDAGILFGDFNFTSAGEENIVTDAGFADAWTTLRPQEVGYTFEPNRNALAAVTSDTGQSARYDRIFVKAGTCLTPSAVKLLGTEPASQGIYLSDHYGICCDFYPEELRPVYRSAVVVIPSTAVWSPIQAIRKEHDRHYLRWMPHITLLYGFVAEDYFERAAAVIAGALASFPAFAVHLTEICHFRHGQSNTVWLKPDTGPSGMLHELQSRLEALFPFCDEQSTKSEGGFTPHLSIAQVKDHKLDEQLARWRGEWQPLEFAVSEVYLISRRGDEPFAIRRSIPLAGKGI